MSISLKQSVKPFSTVCLVFE